MYRETFLDRIINDFDRPTVRAYLLLCNTFVNTIMYSHESPSGIQRFEESKLGVRFEILAFQISLVSYFVHEYVPMFVARFERKE